MQFADNVSNPTNIKMQHEMEEMLPKSVNDIGMQLSIDKSAASNLHRVNSTKNFSNFEANTRHISKSSMFKQPAID